MSAFNRISPLVFFGFDPQGIFRFESSREYERDAWDDDESDSGDRERDFKERGEKDLEEICRYFHLPWGNLAFLAGCVIIEMTLGIWYWLLVMIWAYRKAYRMGVNGRLAVLAALFFNFVAVAVPILMVTARTESMDRQELTKEPPGR